MVQLPRILCVDDEPNILESFRRQLRGKFELEVATSGAAAIEILKSGQKFSVVVSDMRMPGMDGVEFLKHVQKMSPLTVRVMLTGNVDQDTASKAVNEGQIFRFVNKPCSSDVLEKVLEAATAQFNLLSAEKDLLQNTLSGSIKMLSEILSMGDPVAFGSGSAAREPINLIAKTLKLVNVWELDLAAMLHPVGWVTVPETVKNKFRNSQSLTAEETAMIEKIPELGSQFIGSIPRLEGVAKIILYGEKNYDGSGFPKDTVKAKQIPEGARILKIAKELLKLQAQGFTRTQTLESLRAAPAKFDNEIVTKLIGSDESVVSAANEKKEFPITPSQLCPGQRLSANLVCKDGRLLLSAGVYLSELMCKSIVNYAESGSLTLPIMVESRIPVHQSRGSKEVSA